MKQSALIIFTLFVLFLIVYTLNYEGIITIQDWDNLLANLVEKFKSAWARLIWDRLIADPGV